MRRYRVGCDKREKWTTGLQGASGDLGPVVEAAGLCGKSRDLNKHKNNREKTPSLRPTLRYWERMNEVNKKVECPLRMTGKFWRGIVADADIFWLIENI